MVLADVTLGDPHVAAHNAERAEINKTSLTQISVKAAPYNATGNGTTNDLAAIHAARDAAAALGASLYFPPGTYLVNTTAIMNAANQTWTFAPGATLKASASTGNCLEISADNCKVFGYGATFDANNGGTSAGSMLYAHGADNRIEGVTLINMLGLAINLSGAQRPVVVHNKITSPGGNTAVYTSASGAGVTMDSPFIAHNTITMTGGSGYAMSIHNDTGGITERARIFDNKITCPALVSSGIALELYGGCKHAVVSNNTIIGGSMGISADSTVGCAFDDNTIYGAYGYAIEFASASNCTANGNTIDGNALTNYGIILSNTGGGNNSIGDNCIYNMNATNGVGISCQGVGGTGTTIDGNSVVARKPVYVAIAGVANVNVCGNNLTGIAAVTTSAVEINNSQTVGVWDNICVNTAAVANVYSGAMTDIVIGPNIWGAGTTSDVINGWTPGTTGAGSRVIRGNSAPGNPTSPSVTASPMTYTNTSFYPAVLYVKGGTVSSITRGGVTLYTSTDKNVYLNSGEAVVITYSVAPTLALDVR